MPDYPLQDLRADDVVARPDSRRRRAERPGTERMAEVRCAPAAPRPRVHRRATSAAGRPAKRFASRSWTATRRCTRTSPRRRRRSPRPRISCSTSASTRRPANIATWTETDTKYAAEIRVSFDKAGLLLAGRHRQRQPAISGPAGSGAAPISAASISAGFPSQRPPNWQRRGEARVPARAGLPARAPEHARAVRGGHALGRRSPATCRTQDARGAFIADANGRRPGIYTYLSGFPNFWSKAKIDFNLRTQEDPNAVAGAFEKDSVMLYRFPALFYRTRTAAACPRRAAGSRSPRGTSGGFACCIPAPRRSSRRWKRVPARPSRWWSPAPRRRSRGAAAPTTRERGGRDSWRRASARSSADVPAGAGYELATAPDRSRFSRWRSSASSTECDSPTVRLAARELHQARVVAVERVQLLLGQVLGVQQPVAGALLGRHQLVELEVHRERVLVLRPLDEEDHQERDDRGAGVDDELPGVRVAEERARRGPTRPRSRAPSGTCRSSPSSGSCSGRTSRTHSTS